MWGCYSTGAHFSLCSENWGNFQQWFSETVGWGGKGSPVWGLLPVQLFEFCRTHSLAGNHIPRSLLKTRHPQEVLLMTELTANDNFRGLKWRHGNPSLKTTTRKASRSHKETKGWAELPDLPSRGNVPTKHMTFFSLWSVFSFATQKCAVREQQKDQKGLWKVRKV